MQAVLYLCALSGHVFKRKLELEYSILSILCRRIYTSMASVRRM
jgi:hypothetical protein